MLYPSLDFKNYFHVDHIYPKSKFTKHHLKEKGIPDTDIDKYMYKVNSISNLQLLAAIPNEEKSDTEFDDWFREQNPTANDKKQYRDLHMMPEMDYNYDNFLAFTEKRDELLAKALKRILL